MSDYFIHELLLYYQECKRNGLLDYLLTKKKWKSQFVLSSCYNCQGYHLGPQVARAIPTMLIKMLTIYLLKIINLIFGFL